MSTANRRLACCCSRRCGLALRLPVQAAPLFDKIVFGKIKEKLGGRVKLVVSGEQMVTRSGSASRASRTLACRQSWWCGG